MSELLTQSRVTPEPTDEFLIIRNRKAERGLISDLPIQYAFSELPPNPEKHQLWWRTNANGLPIDSWQYISGQWRSIQLYKESRFIVEFTTRTTKSYVDIEVAGISKPLWVGAALIVATPLKTDTGTLVVDLEASTGSNQSQVLSSQTFGPITEAVLIRREVQINQALVMGQKLRFSIRTTDKIIGFAGITVATEYRLIWA